MDKGTGAIVGAPGMNCIICHYCAGIHEEDSITLNSNIFVRILCGSCMRYGIQVCEFDGCSGWKEREETDGE